jgi:hypothetical protein
MASSSIGEQIATLEDAELDEVHGGLSIQTTPVQPILTPQMIANFHVEEFFVPRIRIVPRG